jgi:hypothetical protein
MAGQSLQLLAWPFRKRTSLPTAAVLPTVSPAVRRRIRVVIQYGLLAFLLLILIVWLGAEVEDFHVHRASDTLPFYGQPEVCGIINKRNNTNATGTDNVSFASSEETSLEIRTFPSKDAASSNNSSGSSTTIEHCGECGFCSNPTDISIYDNTKNTLFGTTVKCAKRSMIWGRKTASKCMSHVGFSDGCRDCWVENIICDLRKCIFTCVWQGLFNQVDSGKTSQALNRCTQCDELRCGPSFVTCAGANRRRSGILSDIERDQQKEVCDAVENGWWKDEALRQQWERQQQQVQSNKEGD